jgi:hypothetical protein
MYRLKKDVEVAHDAAELAKTSDALDAALKKFFERAQWRDYDEIPIKCFGSLRDAWTAYEEATKIATKETHVGSGAIGSKKWQHTTYIGQYQEDDT